MHAKGIVYKGKEKEKHSIQSLLFRCCATSALVTILDGSQLETLPMRVSSPTRFSILVVLWNEADEGVAQLVWSRAGWPRVVTCTIDASNSVRALIEGVVAPWGSAIVAWWWRLQVRVWYVVGTYLDGRNGIGKIPP